jgi:hypothetical protein
MDHGIIKVYGSCVNQGTHAKPSSYLNMEIYTMPSKFAIVKQILQKAGINFIG